MCLGEHFTLAIGSAFGLLGSSTFIYPIMCSYSLFIFFLSLFLCVLIHYTLFTNVFAYVYQGCFCSEVYSYCFYKPLLTYIWRRAMLAANATEKLLQGQRDALKKGDLRETR